MKWEQLPIARKITPIITGALQRAFLDRFRTFGCVEEPAVAISSGIDPTVRFIGSHISVLKPYLQQHTLPRLGLVCLQDCVRTHNLRFFGSPQFFPIWGSYFQSLGVLVPPDLLRSVSSELLAFFLETLKCPRNRLVARVHSEDRDLLGLCQTLFNQEEIEIDTRPLSTYRHAMGDAHLIGRNCDLAIRPSGGGEAHDVGNIIVLEEHRVPRAIELAFGTSAIACRLLGLDHVLDCHPVPQIGLSEALPGVRRQLEDIVITATALYREGLRPSNCDNRSRLFKKYLACAPALASFLQVDMPTLSDITTTYAALEYPAFGIPVGEMLFGDGS